MLVDLRRLKSNPFRDLTVDPIDANKVAELKASIQEDGYWGGVVARRRNGDIEIAAGHHRVQAALAAGIRQADIYLGDDIDDAGMVRIYARENATQRGNTATAQAGSIAAAIRVIAKMVLGGVSPQLGRHSISILRGQIATEKGIGQDVIEQFLDGVPGVSSKSIEQQLANLKASGNYARIIGEIKEQIEEENREALKALARAEKERAEAEERERKAEEARKDAAAKAKVAREEADRKRAEAERQRAEAEAKLAEKRRAEAEVELKKFDALRQTRDLAEKAADASAGREKTFDFEGVAKVLHNTHQIGVFRAKVTGQGMRDYLPVENQAKVARQLVALAKERDAELSASFISEHLSTLVFGAKQTERKISREEREAAHRRSLEERARFLQGEFARGCALMIANGVKLRELRESWPKGVPFPITAEFRSAVKDAAKQLEFLNRRL